MKPIIKIIMILTLLVGLYFLSKAQTDYNISNLSFDTIKPYHMEVTYNKTSHLIFPAAIRYVDLGSEYLIAGKADDADNVLRVKSLVRDFKEETNFSVITDDGHFYNFNVLYRPDPAVLNYHLMPIRSSSLRLQTNGALFKELGTSSPTLSSMVMESISRRNKKNLKHINSSSYGIQFQLKGIYIYDGKFYFHTELRNSSNIPYQIDFISFKIVDKKVRKRTIVQEQTLTPLRSYKSLTAVGANSTFVNVFLMDLFTMSNDQVLQADLFEKNGGRRQRLRFDNTTLLKAKQIKDMHLEID